jgi:hypothetical protein
MNTRDEREKALHKCECNKVAIGNVKAKNNDPGNCKV